MSTWKDPLSQIKCLYRLNMNFCIHKNINNNKEQFSPVQSESFVFCHEAGMGGSWDLAFQDILSAFEHFLSESGDRPILLAGHSQGRGSGWWLVMFTALQCFACFWGFLKARNSSDETTYVVRNWIKMSLHLHHRFVRHVVRKLRNWYSSTNF